MRRGKGSPVLICDVGVGEGSVGRGRWGKISCVPGAGSLPARQQLPHQRCQHLLLLLLKLLLLLLLLLL